MRYVKYSTMVLMLAFLAGCSPPPEPPPPAKTVFDPLTQQMDRARETQKIVDEGAERTRKAVDAQERDPPP
jgi:hypothetical protein